MRKTILVRPILVATNKQPQIGDICVNSIQTFIWTVDHVKYGVVNSLPEYKNTKAYQLIFISLNKREIFQYGDMVYYTINDKLFDVYADKNGLIYYNLNGSENSKIPLSKEDCFKVFALQPQIRSNYIEQFVDEHNKNFATDVEIEIIHHNNYSDVNRMEDIEYTRPKLVNGFVTIVNDEFPRCLQLILDDKAESNNRIDLDVYAKGLLDCYNMLKNKYYSEDELKEKCKTIYVDGSSYLHNSFEDWFSHNKKK